LEDKIMKEKVDLLVKDGIIVTMDGKRRVIDNGAVAIKGNKIVAVANSEEVQNKYSADETINAKGMAVMPGLIDTHTHNLQIFLRGRTWGAPLKIPGWLSLLIPFESALTKEEAYLSGLLSCINMIKVGTTGHIDHGGQFNAFEVGRAMEKTGVRAILSRSTIDMGAPDYFSTSTEDAIKENVKLVEKWNGVAGGRIRAWFSLRQIMVCTDELWVKFSELASKYKTGIQTHLSEGMYEVDWAYNHWGKRPVEHYYETGFLQKNVLIAHAMYLTDKEVKMLKE
jgi:5-methylthioadenosine/S-adenosylhomocysteine deaminase